MSPRTWLASAALALCALLSLHGLAQRPDATAPAIEAGKRADAAELERIVGQGDPAMVQAFGRGLTLARIETLPPDVEAVVVKHFDHPVVGPALRAIPARYTSRALFDLHLARVKAAHRSDEPSFERILHTDQRGIEQELLAVADRFPTRAGRPNGAVWFLGQRKHPAAVPLLLPAMEAGYAPQEGKVLYNMALDLLLAYPSEEVWRKAAAELERLKAAGKVRPDQYAFAREKVDRLLADPRNALARVKSSDAWGEYVKRREALVPNGAQVRKLQDTPREYVEAQARYLERVEAVAAEFDDARVAQEPANLWGDLGLYVRFRIGDPRLALPYFERAAKGRSIVGELGLADTYQFALKDKAAALKAYERALKTASNPQGGITPYWPAGNPMNDFWRGWLAAEIAYLRTGQRFTGRVPEAAIVGFWDAMEYWSGAFSPSFPEWPAPHPYASLAVSSARGPMLPTWPTIEAALDKLDRPTLDQRLKEAPTTRFALFATLRYVSGLPDAEAILRELARADPSGYWTTIVLGTVAFHESTPARRDDALANGIAVKLPGMAAKPNALAAAARRHLQSRALRVAEKR